MPRKRDPNRIPNPVGRPPKHNWALLLDGDEHLLTRGQQNDFQCTIESMQQQVRFQASKLGITVSARRYANTGVLIQADLSKPRTGTNAKYDWDALLNGETHSLVVGRDIYSTPESFKVYARRVAHERELGLQIRTMDNVILLKALPRDQEPKRGEPAVVLAAPARTTDPGFFPFEVIQ